MSKRIRYCGIPSCANNRGTTNWDIPFFRIPLYDLELRQKWVDAIKTLYGVNIGKQNIRICILHFRPDDYYKKHQHENRGGDYRLKKEAVPSVPIQPTAAIKIESEPEPELEIKTEPEPEPEPSHCTEDLEQNTFNYVDIGSIRNGATKSKPVEPNRCSKVMDTIKINGNDSMHRVNMLISCNQCKDYSTQVSELILKNSEIRRKCEDLLKENQSLKTILLDNNGKKGEKQKRSRCQVCNVFGTNDNHLCSNETEITCEYCSASFKTIIEFGTHLSGPEHQKMVLYKCERCEKGFPSAILLRLHQKSKLTHIDTHLDTDTIEESVIKSPMDTSSMEQIFKCGMCDKSFEKSDELKIHLKGNRKNCLNKNSPGPKFECYICKMRIVMKRDLNNHMKKHVAARDKKCMVCDENLTLKELDEHFCHGKKSICCEYCNTTFSVTSKLLQHLDSHDDRIMSKCRDCPRFFGMNTLKLLHEKQHENEEPKSFMCEICSKGFREKYLLKSHLKRHETKSDFLCSECGKIFTNRTGLRIHSMSHGEKRFKCPDCPFTCTAKQFLSNHRDIHRNIKYKCTKCDKVFLSRRTLYKHKSVRHRVGGIEKKHQCTLCPLKFMGLNKLMAHLSTHTNEKPFACEMCPKKYKYKGDLNKHMRTHLGENMYQCNLCDENFRLDWQLKRHSFVHYKKEKSMQIDS